MLSTERPSFNNIHPKRDVGGENARGHRQKPEKPYRSSRKDFQFKSDKPPMSRRVARTIVLFLFAVLVGVGSTLASQSYRDEIIKVFPPFGRFSAVSTTKAPVTAVTTAELQEQLKPLAIDLALVRRSIEQLTSNLDQLARKQDQLAQNMATAAEQGGGPKVSALPLPPKTVYAPLPPAKPLQPAAQ